jgi:YegS/Rv2252/BmrU family lipid kinase
MTHFGAGQRGGRRDEKAALHHEIKAQRRAVLIVNTLSRRGARFYAQAKAGLVAAGLTLDATYPVRHAERMPEIAREAIGHGHRFIIIGGGDGSVSSVVDHFAYAPVVFGLLPFGTANSFARTLGIPLDLPGAIDVLVHGKVADVDLGMIDGDYFANGSGIGLPAAVGRATPHGLKRWLGRLGYVLTAANEFMRHRPFCCRVVIAGRERSFEALDVRIASGGYQGGVMVAPEADPDDGELALHILKGASKWALAREWARLVLHLPFRPADIQILRASECRIDTEPRQDVAVDGEVLTQTPVKVSVGRNALLIMVPPGFEDV